MASLERRKGKHAWRVNYRKGGRGTPLLHSEWTNDKAEAGHWKDKIEREQGAEITDKDARGRFLTWPVIVEKWKEYKLGKEKSQRYITEGHARLLALGETHKWAKNADVVDTEDLSIYDYRLVRAVAQWAHQRLDQPLPVLRSPDRPRQKRPKKELLEPGVIVRLIEQATEWAPANGAIAHIVAIYGHRPQTLVGIPVGAVRLGGLRPTMTGPFKGQGMDSFQLLPHTVALLRPLMAGKKPTDPLFVSHLGDPWKTGQEYSTWFHHYVGDYEIGIYQLKCYAITAWLDAGVDLSTVAAVTKHQDVKQLFKYLRSNGKRQAQALAIKSMSPVLGVPRVPMDDEPEVISPDQYTGAGSSIG